MGICGWMTVNRNQVFTSSVGDTSPRDSKDRQRARFSPAEFRTTKKRSFTRSTSPGFITIAFHYQTIYQALCHVAPEKSNLIH